jgi:hypothetical protein
MFVVVYIMYCIPVESDQNVPNFINYVTYVTNEFTFEWPLLVIQPSTATPIANKFNIPLCMHLNNHKVLCVHIFDAIDFDEPVIKVPEKILHQYHLQVYIGVIFSLVP